MVAYGSSLRRSRRSGWESAYVNYQALKSILERMDATSDGVELNALEQSFRSRLDRELDKAALFVTCRLGDIAAGLGAVEFSPEQLLLAQGRDLEGNASPDDHEEEEESEGAAEDDEPVESTFAALLPRESFRISVSESQGMQASAPIFPHRQPPNNISSNIDDGSNHDDAYLYAVWGVELLHMLRFICINAVGVRKILKKHAKIVGRVSIHGRTTASLLDAKYEPRRQPLQKMAQSYSVTTLLETLQAATKHCNLQSTSSMATAITATTANSIRLHCILQAANVLQDHAKRMDQNFRTFLSHKSRIHSRGGASTVGGGGGMDDANDSYLLRFQPDVLLTLENDALQQWWQQGRFQHRGRLRQRRPLTPQPSQLSLDDQSMDDMDHMLLEDGTWGGVDAVAMAINLMSILLYTVNYYVVAPTANHYAILLGTDGAFGATLVGASSLAAIGAALCYSWWYTRGNFRSVLLCSAVCPFVGNLFYALAISYHSMGMAIGGRILVGLGSAEVVNRQLISSCVSLPYMTQASALFVTFGAAGMSVGPLLAAILDSTAGRDTDVDLKVFFAPNSGIIFNHVTSPGFVMAMLWLCQIFALVWLFHEPMRINTNSGSDDGNNGNTNKSAGSSTSKYGSIDSAAAKSAGSSLRRGGPRSGGWCQECKTVGSLIFQNVALPITLLLFGFIELVDEVLISSCSMICRRYFAWKATRAGILLASLGALVLPAHFVVERASHRYEERAIMKYSLILIGVTLLGMLNYEGMVFDLIGLAVEVVEPISPMLTNTSTHGHVDVEIGGESIKSVLNKHKEVPYNWAVGTYTYIIFLSAVFMGTIVLEGVDTSLMATASPPALNDSFFNSGLLATLVGTLGRVAGDSMITIGAFLDHDIFTDFANVTFFPMIPLAAIGFLLVKCNYKKFIFG